MREQISKWNGKMPDVMASGSRQGILFNLPAAHSAGEKNNASAGWVPIRPLVLAT